MPSTPSLVPAHPSSSSSPPIATPMQNINNSARDKAGAMGLTRQQYQNARDQVVKFLKNEVKAVRSSTPSPSSSNSEEELAVAAALTGNNGMMQDFSSQSTSSSLTFAESVATDSHRPKTPPRISLDQVAQRSSDKRANRSSELSLKDLADRAELGPAFSLEKTRPTTPKQQTSKPLFSHQRSTSIGKGAMDRFMDDVARTPKMDIPVILSSKIMRSAGNDLPTPLLEQIQAISNSNYSPAIPSSPPLYRDPGVGIPSSDLPSSATKVGLLWYDHHHQLSSPVNSIGSSPAPFPAFANTSSPIRHSSPPFERMPYPFPGGMPGSQDSSMSLPQHGGISRQNSIASNTSSGPIRRQKSSANLAHAQQEQATPTPAPYAIAGAAPDYPVDIPQPTPVGVHVPEPNKYNSSTKPPYSYAALIGQAILNQPTKRLSLADIYTYIMLTYPFYKKPDAGWQNSIRHNLSLNHCFVKTQRTNNEPGKGCLWAVAPETESQFAGGGFVKRGAKATGSAAGTTKPKKRKKDAAAAKSNDAGSEFGENESSFASSIGDVEQASAKRQRLSTDTMSQYQQQQLPYGTMLAVPAPQYAQSQYSGSQSISRSSSPVGSLYEEQDDVHSHYSGMRRSSSFGSVMSRPDSRNSSFEHTITSQSITMSSPVRATMPMQLGPQRYAMTSPVQAHSHIPNVFQRMQNLHGMQMPDMGGDFSHISPPPGQVLGLLPAVDAATLERRDSSHTDLFHAPPHIRSALDYHRGPSASIRSTDVDNEAQEYGLPLSPLRMHSPPPAILNPNSFAVQSPISSIRDQATRSPPLSPSKKLHRPATSTASSYSSVSNDVEKSPHDLTHSFIVPGNENESGSQNEGFKTPTGILRGSLFNSPSKASALAGSASSRALQDLQSTSPFKSRFITPAGTGSYSHDPYDYGGWVESELDRFTQHAEENNEGKSNGRRNHSFLPSPMATPRFGLQQGYSPW